MDRKKTTPLWVSARTFWSFGVPFLLLLSRVGSVALPGPDGSNRGMVDPFSPEGQQLPEIVARGDIVLQAGDSFTIDCIGNAPLKWSWDIQPHSLQADYPDNRVWNEDLVLTENIYQRTLRFSHAQFFNTGVYFCDYVSNDTTTTTTTTTLDPLSAGWGPAGQRDKKKLTGASIRLFVSDTSHMFTQEANFNLLVVQVYYGHQVTIPCSVSDPTFNVTLTHIFQNKDYSNRKDVTYDPMKGFIVAFPYYAFLGSFQCRARVAGNVMEEDQAVPEEVMNLYLKYHDTDVLSPPYLHASAAELLVGSTVTFTCKIKVKPNMRVDLHMLYQQSGTPDESRVVLEGPVRKRKKEEDHDFDEMTLIMELHDVTVSDSGEYGCEVRDLASCPQCDDNRQRATVGITVYEEEFISLTPSLDVIRISSTADFAYFFVTIKAFPTPNLEWRHNGQPLQANNIYHMEQARRAANLKIIRPRASDSGLYTLFASTRHKNASANITLLVYE